MGGKPAKAGSLLLLLIVIKNCILEETVSNFRWTGPETPGQFTTRVKYGSFLVTWHSTLTLFRGMEYEVIACGYFYSGYGRNHYVV